MLILQHLRKAKEDLEKQLIIQVHKIDLLHMVVVCQWRRLKLLYHNLKQIIVIIIVYYHLL